ncbi:MAG: F0F1 ATP synthase subunit A [Planctomycetes bacterium]|nr:F0F1 ATP synthase subunit A [Planctomycetota bacterium]
MNLVRPLLIAGLIVAGILFATAFTPHHPSDSEFITLFGHLVPHTLASGAPGAETALLSIDAPWLFEAGDGDPYKDGTQIAFSNLQVFQLLAIVLLVVAFSGVPGYLKSGRGDWVSRVFAGFALWVRDEMVYPVMGREVGRKFLPFLYTLFFFVLFMNLLGLLPGSSTATASVFVTAGLAAVTLLVMLFGGMAAQGPLAYWKNLVPHVPIGIWPIMFVVEFVGIFVKPFALMIRLFANMTGGHMVVLSFMGLIFVASRPELLGPIGAYATSPVLVGFGVFIMIIESFVAMLQAYVFTMLSILFIQASIHPEH